MMDEIYEKLLRMGFAEELFAELKKNKQTGSGQFIACCPFHDDKNPSFSYSTILPVWTCFAGCGSGNWQTYLERKLNIDATKAIEYLANAAGVELSGLDTSDLYAESRQRRILNEAFGLFREELKNPNNKDVLDYLQARGFTLSDIEAMKLGAYPGGKKISEYLRKKGFSMAQIKQAFVWIEVRDAYKLVIPQKDRFGNLAGFVGRLIDPQVTKNKYKPLSVGLTKDSVFNLHTVRGHTSAVVVEGYFDALLLEARSLGPIVAVTKATFSEYQLKSLTDIGVNQLTFCFDADDAGIRGMQAAVELCARMGIKSFVTDMRGSGAKDPAEYVGNFGAMEFEKMLRRARQGTDWLAFSYAHDADLSNPKGIEAFVQRSLHFSARHLTKNSREKNSYIQIVASAIDATSFALLEEERKYLTPGLTNASGSAGGQPSSLVEFLRLKQDRDSRRETRLLGYKSGLFNQLEENISGIQPGFYIIAADTNVGKTALLTNLFLEAILSNSEITGLYLSLDDSRDTIINRFLSILSGIDLVSVQLSQKSPENRQKLANSYEVLQDLADAGRLDLRDLSQLCNVDQLETLIQYYTMDRPLLVAIDGLYNLQIDASGQGIREENIQRALQMKRLVDTYGIPIITTGELRKRQADDRSPVPTIHDLMETGKFSYNANLVWLLYPKNTASFGKEADPLLVLDYAKNKLSHFKGQQLLKFTKAIGKLSEVKTPGLKLLPKDGQEKGD